MKICPRCGFQNIDTDPVCRRCGLPLMMQGDPVSQQMAGGFIPMQQTGYTQQPPAGMLPASGPVPSEAEPAIPAEKPPVPDASPEKEPVDGKKAPAGAAAPKRAAKPAVSFWQVLSALCLLGILIIMVYKNFGSDISSFVRKTVRKASPPPASTVVTNPDDEDVTVEDLFAETAKESDPLFDKIGALAEHTGLRNFDDLDLDELLSDSRASSAYVWDITWALNDNETSLKHKNAMREFIGKYYLIEGTVKDIFSNGRVQITAENAISSAGISVYGFTEEQLLKFNRGDKIKIIVKIIYADSIDGNDTKYYMAALYVQDKP